MNRIKEWNLTDEQIKLFETKSYKEIAVILNTSINSVCYLKKKYRPDLLRKCRSHPKQEIETRLKSALIDADKNNSFNISKFCKEFGYNQPQISSFLCELVAYKHGIKFYKKSEHSYSVYSRKLCSCDLCKLNASIYQRYKVRKIFIPSEQISKWVVKYKNSYDSDKSRYRKVFYSIIDEEVKKFNDNQ